MFNPTAETTGLIYRIMVHSSTRFDSNSMIALNIIKTKQLRSTMVGFRPNNKARISEIYQKFRIFVIFLDHRVKDQK